MEFEHRYERRLWDANAFTVSLSSHSHTDSFGYTDTKLHAQLVGGS
jgi:hypothetical protein